MRAGARITDQVGRAVHRRALSLETVKRDERQLALDFDQGDEWRPEDDVREVFGEWEGEA